ncbi:MAG: ATP-binding protein [Asticcacaulis sp.]
MKTRPYSLLRVLFVSMAVLATLIYLVVQIRDAGQFGLTPQGPVERWSVLNMVVEYRYALIMILTTWAAIWLTLHFALRPIRRLSQRAGAIGPANLHERLPLDDAPSEIAPLVSAFNLSLDRLEAAWAAQRAFSANAAHELRTPLGALRAEVESLVPAQDRRAATAEFDRLTRLIEQLLFLAEADQDRLSHTGRFDLVEQVRETAMEMAPRILSAGREIGFDSEIEPRFCRGDAILAGIAVRNLIENGVRHTPEGTRIDISISRAGVVSVRDNGRGVPEAFEPRLFERFSKSDAGGYGAGLGLSIVTRIMALHGGTVTYQRLAVGCAFHLVFPEAEDEQAVDTASGESLRKAEAVKPGLPSVQNTRSS